MWHRCRLILSRSSSPSFTVAMQATFSLGDSTTYVAMHIVRFLSLADLECPWYPLTCVLGTVWHGSHRHLEHSRQARTRCSSGVSLACGLLAAPYDVHASAWQLCPIQVIGHLRRRVVGAAEPNHTFETLSFRNSFESRVIACKPTPYQTPLRPPS